QTVGIISDVHFFDDNGLPRLLALMQSPTRTDLCIINPLAKNAKSAIIFKREIPQVYKFKDFEHGSNGRQVSEPFEQDGKFYVIANSALRNQIHLIPLGRGKIQSMK